MSDVKWIKISVDIFNDEKLQAIGTLPDGNMIQLVWIKLLCLAGKCNEGGLLMVTRELPYTDEMLAKRFDMEIGEHLHGIKLVKVPKHSVVGRNES